MNLIDIGVNLTASSFRSDRSDVVVRAQQVGVGKMIITGSSVEDSHSVVELIHQYPECLYGTAGIHPHHADRFDESSIEALRQLQQHEGVVAVGECGLDFNRNYSVSANQRKAFDAQLELAVELRKPVFLHQRDAFEDFVSMIKNCLNGIVNSVAHCFTGTPEQAVEYLDMGMYIGVTGWICDERRGHDLREAVKQIPLDRIMLETDAPYLLPRDLAEKPLHSRRNEPCFLPHICRVTAAYMGVNEEELALASVENAKRFFCI